MNGRENSEIRLYSFFTFNSETLTFILNGIHEGPARWLLFGSMTKPSPITPTSTECILQSVRRIAQLHFAFKSKSKNSVIINRLPGCSFFSGHGRECWLATMPLRVRGGAGDGSGGPLTTLHRCAVLQRTPQPHRLLDLLRYDCVLTNT